MLKKIFQKRQVFLPLDKADWGILLLGLAVFATITLSTIGHSSIWFDEAFGAYLIRFDFWQIASYTAADVHPPLYYWLLKGWSMLFGTSELALRSMSALFAGVAIVFGFLLAKRLFGRKAAWFALILMVLSPMLIRYGQEMRMYTLVTAIALAATYVLTFAMESKKRRPWIVYGILVALGMWTHYFTALIWLTHWAWRAWVVRSEHKTKKKFIRAFLSREWILAHVVAVGVFLPWMPALIRQVLDVQVNGFWIPPVTPTTIPNFLTNVFYYLDQEQAHSWLALVFLIIMITVVSLCIRLVSVLQGEERKSYLLLLALAVAPMVMLFVSSMPPLQSSFVDRYLIPSTLAIALFIGVTLTIGARYIRPQLRYGVTLLVVGAMAFGVYNVYHLGNYNKTLHSSNNTRQAIEEIKAHALPGEPIIADSPWLFYEAVFYDTSEHPVYFIDANTEYRYGSLNMLRDNDQHKIKDLGAFTRDHPVVWYLGRPGQNSLTAPYGSWKPQQQAEVNDSVNGRPSYKAVQYQAN
jgi:4-amino-4-deoxy-L-arabinose transferase-like glycosyltransferase